MPADETMRAWRTHEYGPRPTEVLQLDTVPIPVPDPGEVRVRVQAIPLNLNDLERINGGNMMVRPELPYSPGMEVMGVVDACGAGAEDLEGRRVVATTKGANGGFAQSLNDLALPAAGATQAFISEPLGANGVIRSGYHANLSADVGAMVVTPAAKTCNGSSADAMSGYFAERHPESIGYTGQRAFAIATSATIYVKDDGTLIAPGMAGASALR